ncbi:MAG: 50S ribosomal protein L30 [Candidatus Aminicenantes bacterium]|nr:MAG: 50S ribosomal protein L30 [Candidatus Aminicenantes bacterium]
MALKEETPKKVKERKATKAPVQKVKSSEKQLKVKLVRSLIGHPRKQREVVKGLGLRKVNSEVIRQDCPEIWGMIRKIPHLIKVEVLEKK